MKAIQIDFSTTSDADLRVILKRYAIKYDELIEKHKKFGFYKIFIDLDTFKLFAYILVSDKNKVEFTDGINEVLLSIKPEVVEEEKPQIDIDISFDVDQILEKISKFGINSLTKAEKDFLDNQSK